jgi:hypothetical protein
MAYDDTVPNVTADPYAQQGRTFFVAFLFLVIFAEGVRLGGVPVPSSLLLCALYIAIYNPRIPTDVGAIAGGAFLCILLISTRNALALTGGVKDFLYIGIVVESFLVTICLIDATTAIRIADIRKILLIFVCAELLLQIVEYLSPVYFDGMIHSLLSYWDKIDNSNYGAGFDAGLPVYGLRVPGSFGSPTTAGFATYFLIRSLAIIARRRWIIFGTIIPLVICGARTAFIIFLVWEIVVPIFSSKYRKVGLYSVLVVGVAVTAMILFYPEFFGQIFVIDTFIQLYNRNTFATAASIFNRIYGAQYALSRPLSQWIIGGMTAQEMAAFTTNIFSFDSELVQRSLQYGLIGYASFLAINLCAGYDRKNWDWWFSVAMVAVGSLTNSVATNVILFPFLILYNVCLRRIRAVDEDLVPGRYIPSS